MKSLTNVILKSSKRTNKNRGDGKKETFLSFIAFSIVFLSLAIAMTIISYIVTQKLIQINQSYTFINILLVMNFFILFTKSVFESLNVLYFSKDLKILLRMPINSKDILHAKFINMIISEYEMETIMLAIPMVVYGILNNVNIIFYIYMITILLILPIIPILITSLITSVIMRFTNKIKNKSKVMYIAIIFTSLLTGIILSGFGSGGNSTTTKFEEIIMKTNGLSEKISDQFILIKPIMNTLLNYNNIKGLQNLILYILENVIIYIIIIFIISKIYLKGAIGTTINSQKNNKNRLETLTIKDFKQKNINKSYILKELKTISRTPIFLIQCIIIPIIYPITIIVASIILAIFANKFIDIWGNLAQRANQTIGVAMFLSLGQVFYMMNFSSIIAVSRESKNVILTKYIPITLSKQFKLKTILGIILNILAGILVTIFYYMCTKNKVTTILIFIELLLINLIGEKFKLLVDLKKPQINWNSEYTMMKQNTNVMYILFYTLIVIGVLLITSKISNIIEIFLTTMIIISLIINISINTYVNKKESKIFEKLY